MIDVFVDTEKLQIAKKEAVFVRGNIWGNISNKWIIEDSNISELTPTSIAIDDDISWNNINNNYQNLINHLNQYGIPSDISRRIKIFRILKDNKVEYDDICQISPSFKNYYNQDKLAELLNDYYIEDDFYLAVNNSHKLSEEDKIFINYVFPEEYWREENLYMEKEYE